MNEDAENLLISSWKLKTEQLLWVQLCWNLLVPHTKILKDTKMLSWENSIGHLGTYFICFFDNKAKENSFQTFRIANYLTKIQESANKLAEIYEDKEKFTFSLPLNFSSRKNEIESLYGQGPTLYGMFYEKLKDLKEYHQKFPDVPVEDPDEKIYMDVDGLFTF